MKANETKAVAKTQIGQLSETDLQQLELANIIPKGTPPPQVQIFATICKEKSLSPFQKQIYLLPFKQKNGDTWVTHYACIVGIDGYRTIAERTGNYAGSDDAKFNDSMTEFQCRESGLKNPSTATVTIWKIVKNERVAFTATASWDSYLPGNEKKQFNWKRMPFHMIAKCAEALALRKAFPEALSGLHAEEEAGGFENVQDAEVINDMQVSNDVLLKHKAIIDEFTKHDELHEKSQGILEGAKKDGLNTNDIKLLTEYANNVYRKLKDESK